MPQLRPSSGGDLLVLEVVSLTLVKVAGLDTQAQGVRRGRDQRGGATPPVIAPIPEPLWEATCRRNGWGQHTSVVTSRGGRQ